MVNRLCRVVVTLISLTALAHASAQGADNYDVQVLKEHGISADGQGVGQYLSDLFPSADVQQRIDRLIGQLGSDDFSDREDASRRLSRIGGAHDALQEATRSSDAEISHRARRILEETQQSNDSTLLAALRFIDKEKPPGMVPHLIRVLPTCGKEHLRRAASEALVAVASANDVTALTEGIQSNYREVRTASVAALERILKQKSVEALHPLLRSADPATRLAAVEALVNYQPRECLNVLVGLLESEDSSVRLRTDRTLRLLTGQRFGSINDAPTLEARKEIVTKWRGWVAGVGREAALSVPLPTGKARLGRVLVCVNQPGGPNGIIPKVIELNEHWQVSVLRDGDGQMALPFGCQGMSNGHRLYSDWRTQSIIELDENGKEVWQQRVAAGPANVERLENGNTLVAIYQTQQVAEMDRNGQIVWQINVGGSASDAHQLENGNVLVVLSDQGIVAEFDRSGGFKWRATGLPNPWSARRLPNGNTLVACNGAGRAIELSPDAKIVRSIDNVPNCSDADVLENGNLLIGYAQGLREVGPKGETVREQAIGMVRRLSIY